MNILVVSEKPAVSRNIADVARAHWPSDSITFVHAVPYGNFHFNYPRGMKFSDYPVVSEPVHGLSSWESWSCPPFLMAADGTLSKGAMTRELFTSADLIVYACDPDHTGAVAFDILMEQVFGDSRALECPALALAALDKRTVEKAFREMQPFGGHLFDGSRVFGRVKKYFDWNWNVNSLAVLGETQRRAGVPADAPPLSKYALQLLYALRNARPMYEEQVISLMQKWPGTGRYTYEKGQWRPRVGSPASVAQILENLVKAELLERFTFRTHLASGGLRLGPCGLTVSVRGHRLLELLHPDCEDPDLPFRLDAWCTQGLQSKLAIDRYIKTFFGKQLRFL